MRTVVQLETSTPGVTMEIMKAGDRYVVTHQHEMGSGLALVILDWTEPPATITCRWGDREYTFPARCSVSKEVAVSAMQRFFELGERAEDLYWEAVTPEVVARVRRS
jgi:hypothetical protein